MGRLVRKPVVPDLDLQIAGLEGVLQSDIAGTPSLSFTVKGKTEALTQGQQISNRGDGQRLDAVNVIDAVDKHIEAAGVFL